VVDRTRDRRKRLNDRVSARIAGGVGGMPQAGAGRTAEGKNHVDRRGGEGRIGKGPFYRTRKGEGGGGSGELTLQKAGGSRNHNGGKTKTISIFKPAPEFKMKKSQKGDAAGKKGQALIVKIR